MSVKIKLFFTVSLNECLTDPILRKKSSGISCIDYMLCYTYYLITIWSLFFWPQGAERRKNQGTGRLDWRSLKFFCLSNTGSHSWSPYWQSCIQYSNGYCCLCRGRWNWDKLYKEVCYICFWNPTNLTINCILSF